MKRAYALVVFALAFASSASAVWVFNGKTLPTMPYDSEVMLTTYGKIDEAYLPEKPTQRTKSIWLVYITPGSHLWSYWGHIRLGIEFEDGQWSVADWGVWNPTEKGFFSNFMHGMLYYFEENFYPYRKEYLPLSLDEDSRGVQIVQVPLSQGEMDDIASFVFWNAQNGKNKYNYKFFTDNCSTRVRDIINKATGGKLREKLEAIPAPTLRESATKQMDRNPLYSWALNMLAGPEIDKKATMWEACYSPKVLFDAIKDYNWGTEEEPIAPTVEVLKPAKNESEESRHSRVELFSHMLNLGLIIVNALLLLGGGLNAPNLTPTPQQAKERQICLVAFKALNSALLIVFTLLGCLLTWVNSFSLFTFTWQNVNLWWANPALIVYTTLVIVCLQTGGKDEVNAAKRKVLFYFSAAETVLALFALILGAFVHQSTWKAILPFLAITAPIMAVSTEN